MRTANYGVQKSSLALKPRMDWLNANYGSKQVIETEHTLNPVPCNFDIITCKNLDDLHSFHGRQKESQ